MAFLSIKRDILGKINLEIYFLISYCFIYWIYKNYLITRKKNNSGKLGTMIDNINICAHSFSVWTS